MTRQSFERLLKPRSVLARRLLAIAAIIVVFVIVFALLYGLGSSGH
jgi:hypothetical protein